MTVHVLHVLNGERGLETYPSVYNALYLWKRRGHVNEIATAGAVEGFEAWIGRVHRLEGGYAARALQLIRTGAYDVIVVYEPRDIEILYLAQLIGRLPRATHLVHHSLEIPSVVFKRGSVKDLVHKLLYRGYARVDRVAVQDENRRSVLTRLFPHLAGTACYYVPNSYIREIEPECDSLDWFDRVRERSTRLVLYIGAIERWALSMEFFRELRQIEGATFLFSGWCYDGLAEQIDRELGDATNILLSLGKKTRAELNYMVRRCDVGLAFYVGGDDNVASIGFSSGKIMKYLSYDRPVLVNRLAVLDELINARGLGIAAEPGQFREALERIFATYEGFRGNISASYPEVGDFEGPYNRLIDSLVEPSAT